jgi:uncharacterized protein YjbI with pentapeptide repeats
MENVVKIRGLVLLGTGLCLAAVAGGAYLLSSAGSAEQSTKAQLGSGLVTGGVIALVLFVAESMREVRMVQATQRQAFLIQLSLSRNFVGADLRGQDLRGLSFRGKDLRNVLLQGCNLNDVDLSYADLRGANLVSASMRGARLDLADLRLADVRGADLSDSQLNGIDARGVDFGSSKLVNVTAQDANFGKLSREDVASLFQRGVRPVEWYYLPDPAEMPTYFNGVKAYGSDFSGADFSYAQMRGADAALCRFGEAYKPDPLERLGFLELYRRWRKGDTSPH